MSKTKSTGNDIVTAPVVQSVGKREAEFYKNNPKEFWNLAHDYLFDFEGKHIFIIY
jgi:hypothetical protein